MTPREREIMELIRKNPSISQQQLADMLSITRSSVAVHINNLSNQGYILGRGYILRDEPYLVAIGGSNVDIFGYVNNPIIQGDSNPGTIKQSTGGVARNIAENISRLNYRVSLISAIGNDHRGQIILDELNELGIDTENILSLPHDRTSVYFAIINNKGDMEVALNDMEIVDKITPDIIYKKRKIIENAEGTIVDTNISEETIEYILNNIEQKYYVDAVSVTKAYKIKNKLNKIYFLKANKLEAEILSDIKINNIEDAVFAAKKLISSGLKSIVITMGEDGAVYVDRKNTEFVKSDPLEIVNATGAGDAFMAAYVHSDVNNMKIKDRLKFATAASRIALKSERTNSEKLSIENIEEEMKYVK